VALCLHSIWRGKKKEKCKNIKLRKKADEENRAIDSYGKGSEKVGWKLRAKNAVLTRTGTDFEKRDETIHSSHPSGRGTR